MYIFRNILYTYIHTLVIACYTPLTYYTYSTCHTYNKAHCEFLQLFPSVNFYLASNLIARWHLRSLLYVDTTSVGALLQAHYHYPDITVAATTTTTTTNTTTATITTSLNSMLEKFFELVRTHSGLALSNKRRKLGENEQE